LTEFRIANRFIGANHPTYIIAEGCDNHLGDIEKAKEMVVRAKLAGADAIKFQHHLPDEEMLPDVPMSSNFNMPLYDFLTKYSLTLKQHQELMALCKQVGIQYLCTPFSWKAAQELESISVDAFKIGSGEMTDIPTLIRIAEFNKPMMISTGMCTYEEIERTYKSCVGRAPLALFNCVSEYPPVYEDINLGVIQEMKARFPEAVIGHSDHTPDLFTCFAAVTLGAKIVEKHVILDKKQPGPDQSVSIGFKDLAELVDGIRKVEVSLGRTRKVHAREAKIREWAFRSLVSTRPVKAGEVLSEETVWSKRPGTGIPSHKMNEVVGKRARVDIPGNSLIRWDQLET
jgi:N-acetylneuraminate synthase